MGSSHPIQKSQVITTSSLELIQKAFQKANKRTLIVLDIDGVLIKTRQTFRPSSPSSNSAAHLTRLQLEKAETVWLTQQSFDLVSDQMPTLIQSVQKRSIPVCALTHCHTGPEKGLVSLENWRVESLRKFNIQFQFPFPYEKRKVFSNLRNNQGFHPILQSGILFTEYLEKGIVLGAFLDTLPYQLDQIIFVDDRRPNLDSVQRLCHQRGLSFLGFEYTAAKNKKPDSLQF
jgi:hypothetical protein